MAYSKAFKTPAQAGYDKVPVGSRIVRWLGATTSVALIGGLGIWVYDLATRDARTVPVVRALEGPSRSQPEVAGGFTADHQGFAVNRIASEQSDSPLAERVVLAPEATGVSEEDLPAAATPVVLTEPPVDPDAALRSAVEGALTQVLGADQKSSPETAPARQDNGTAGTPRPQPRPAMEIVSRSDLPIVLTSFHPAAQAVELDPRNVPAGTRLVQLGAFDSPEIARAEWERLSRSFGDYLRPKQRVIERTEVAGREFYRLRAYGFASLSDARNFCSVLMAGEVDCIPVLTR